MKNRIDLIQRDLMIDLNSEGGVDAVIPVDVVKVTQLIPIYKEGNEANAIQVARIKNSKGEELQYDIIVGKGLWNIGDTGIYIQPDYCLPFTNHFMEYTQPDGDPKKTKLGKKNRVKAIKFNFAFENGEGPIYSNGVLLPLNDELKTLISKSKDLMKDLEITKYVSEDSLENVQISGEKVEFPQFLYHTDEPTIQNKKSLVDKVFQEGKSIAGTIKKDGSSLTDYYVNDGVFGICSRKEGKKLDQTYIKGYMDGNILLHPYVQKEYFAKDYLSKVVRFWKSVFGLEIKGEKNVKGWYNSFTNTFYTQKEVDKKFEPITAIAKDAWVDVNNEYGYLDKLIKYCKQHNVKLALRGELIGQGNKGSGKSINSDAKLKAQVIWFGVDDLSSGFSKRIHYNQPHNLKEVCEELGLEYTKPVFEGVYDYDSLIKECHKIFDEYEKTKGQILEGIVIRTVTSNDLSVKYINPKYDSKL